MYDIFGGNVLNIVRGNSAFIDITPTDAETGNPVILENGDKVLFTVKTRRGETVIQKVLTNLDYSDPEDYSLNCIIDKDETIDLITGEYRYDCLYMTEAGEAITFISSTLLITEAVGTYKDIDPPTPEPDGGDDHEQ